MAGHTGFLEIDESR